VLGGVGRRDVDGDGLAALGEEGGGEKEGEEKKKKC
jgi:hypothetical protein